MPEPFLPCEPVRAAYVHIPFCASKCSYCDFCSFPGLTAETMTAYVDALCREITAAAREATLLDNKVLLKTVFLGGGTPTVLPTEHLIAILDTLRHHFGLEQDGEFTLEANPGTVTADGLARLRKAGFNRLSFGLQAVQPHLLKRLGRIHSAEDFTAGVSMAKAAGFDSINADIMFGLPEQTVDDVEQTVRQLLRQPIDHVSFYSLILEDNTPLKAVCDADPGLLPDEDTERRQYWRIIELLDSGGLTHYEISNAARPGHRCRHNLVYWHGRPYYGFGVSAHAFTHGIRRADTTDLDIYLSAWQAGCDYERALAATSVELETVDRSSAMNEMLLLGLRLIDGVSDLDFSARFGVSLADVFDTKIQQLSRRGLLVFDGKAARLTAKGLDLANQVFMEFV